jgi:glutamate synthase domain-containing protein 2
MIQKLRSLVFYAVVLLTVLSAWAAWAVEPNCGWALVVTVPLTILGIHDLVQTRSSLLRNYPIIGHLRFLIEDIGPELRQYVVEDDTEGAPFTRDQRSVMYQRAKNTIDKKPFGTELDVYRSGYTWMHHSMAPRDPVPEPWRNLRVTVGTGKRSYSASVLNVSAMSFGSLGANAVLAIGRGARTGGFSVDTGEGGVSRYHRESGCDLVWQIGTGYFGCRAPDGTFDPNDFRERARDERVKMIEIKISQGAKPGHGGVLPGAKVTPEIAAARDVPEGIDCVSPPYHSAFSTPVGLLELITRLRELSDGKPVGFKLCIGDPGEFFAVCKAMLETGVTPDFIVVDGGEGGTGAAPLEFSDYLGMPLREGLAFVRNALVGTGLRDRIRIGASGKRITGFGIANAMALGADWCNTARGFMFALGCLQAQTCHTGHCPTGVATQSPTRQRALVVPDKMERVYRFHQHTLGALRELTQAAGLTHPNQFRVTHFVRRDAQNDIRLLASLLPQVRPGQLLEVAAGRGDWPHNVFTMYWSRASAHTFAPIDVEGASDIIAIQSALQESAA